jgi:hypothetical protein
MPSSQALAAVLGTLAFKPIDKTEKKLENSQHEGGGGRWGYWGGGGIFK